MQSPIVRELLPLFGTFSIVHNFISESLSYFLMVIKENEWEMIGAIFRLKTSVIVSSLSLPPSLGWRLSSSPLTRQALDLGTVVVGRLVPGRLTCRVRTLAPEADAPQEAEFTLPAAGGPRVPRGPSVCFTLSLHYPNFVSTLSQKFELSTQRTKLISYENGMVLYYSNSTMNKYRFICIYVWINTIIICIFSVSSSSVAAPGGMTGGTSPPCNPENLKKIGNSPRFS